MEVFCHVLQILKKTIIDTGQHKKETNSKGVGAFWELMPNFSHHQSYEVP